MEVTIKIVKSLSGLPAGKPKISWRGVIRTSTGVI